MSSAEVVADASVNSSVRSHNARLRRPIRCITVEPVLFIASVCIGMVSPLSQQYIYKRMVDEYAPGLVLDTSSCKQPKLANATFIVEQHSSKWMMSFTVSYMIPTFFSSLLLGSLSDKYGRKYVLLLPLIGGACRQLINILVIGFNLHIAFLFVGYVLDGIFGGTSIIFMSCFAFMSDLTTHENRMLRFVILECCSTVGMIIASIGTGYLIRYIGFLWPNVIVLSLLAVNVLYSITLQETVAKQNANSCTYGFGHLLQPLKLYVSNDFSGRRYKLLVMLLIFVLMNIVDFGRSDCETLHLLSIPFCWSSITLGFFSAAARTASVVTSLVLARLAVRWIGDVGLVLFACISGAAYEVIFPFMKTVAMLFSVTLVGSGVNLIYPVSRTFMSKLVKPDEQGKLLATLAWVQLVSLTLGSMIFNTLYINVVDKYESLAFFVMGGVFGLAAVFTMLLFCKVRQSNTVYEVMISEQPDE